MFSGIVDAARVERVEKRGEDMRIHLDFDRLAEDLDIGDSVSINGVCLTAAEKNGKSIAFDIMPETQERTNLGTLSPGYQVNVEISLRPMDRLGGHFVLGHVDGMGKILKKEREGRTVKLWISSPELTNMMVTKGAVSLDGVSMTLVDVEEGKFSVCIIPHTLEKTTLGSKKEGSSLNIEVDMIGKFIKKYMEEMR